MTEDEINTLAALADQIIPPSAKYGIPGAGDPAIVAEIQQDAARRMLCLADAMQALDRLVEAGVGFTDLDAAARATTVTTFREIHATEANLIASLAAQCYYRDDRVMASLGMEDRAPHPEGYEVKQGDWSLLDPVRQRSSFYRSTE